MTTSTNMKLELLEDTDNFDTNKIKSNFEKIDEKAIIPEKLVNNCVTDNPNLALAASQGKALKGEIDAINGDLSSKLGYIHRLTAADDLNDLFTNGIYYYPTSNVPQNAPFHNAAIVEIFGSLDPRLQKIQRITRYGITGHTAFRPYSDNQWEPWVYGGNPYSLDAAVQIPSGADLNDYATPGNYLCNSAGIAKTLKNCPVAFGGFVLHVERCTGGSTTEFIKQKIVPNSSTSEEYWRNKVSATWRDWRTVAPGNIDSSIHLFGAFDDESKYKNREPDGNTYWTVKNGFCLVNVTIVCVSPSSTTSYVVSESTLPVSQGGRYAFTALSKYDDSAGEDAIICGVNQKGRLYFRGGTAGTKYAGQIIYPIAN